MGQKTWLAGALFLGITVLTVTPMALGHSLEDHMGDMHDMHAGHDHSGTAIQDHSGHVAPTSAPAIPENAPIKLSSKPLVDQNGRSVTLQKDVIGQRIVVLTFVYTNCTTVCPVVSSILSDLQNKLGDRLNTDVRLVSLTVDPANDTPSRLKSYSERFDAKPGWLWLTGSSANVTEALKGFGAYTPNFENHPVVVLIGDGRTGKWSRHYGLSKSELLLREVDEYLAARKASGGKGSVLSAQHDHGHKS